MTSHLRRNTRGFRSALPVAAALTLSLLAACSSSTSGGSTTAAPTTDGSTPATDVTDTTVAESTTTSSTLPPIGCPGGEEGMLQQGDGVDAPCDSVIAMQTLLIQWGFPIEPDGRFGPATAAAVSTFQRERGLPEDGHIDGATYASLLDVAEPADITLTPDGIGGALIGDDPEAVITYLTDHLGAPTNDEGWVDVSDGSGGVCASPELRGVSWGNLHLVFAWQAPLGGGADTRQFVYYDYSFADATIGKLLTPRMRTDLGLELGDDVPRLTTLYPGSSVFDSEFGGRAYQAPEGAGIAFSGTLYGSSPERVNSIDGGIYPCGE
jgi:peptidoglycan hydrolase-like protein with peptidoglycan-binding domain